MKKDRRKRTQDSKPVSEFPRFLTRELAEKAVGLTLDTVMMGQIGQMLKRKTCHVVIVAPARVTCVLKGGTKHSQIIYTTLFEATFGDASKWRLDYAAVARNKAAKMARGFNANSSESQPHLLFVGDTPYPGCVEREGIIVACSGVQAYFDKLIAGMVADMLIAFARHAWLGSKDSQYEIPFLTFD